MSKFYVNNNGRVSMEIEGAKLKYGGWFSNWSGRTDGVFHYNGVDRETGKGYRYFTVKLPSEFVNEVDGNTWTIADLKELGIPVKTYEGNPEKGYEDEHTLKVKIAYKFKAPVVQVDMAGIIANYTEDDIHRLDNMAYEDPDIVLGFGKMNPDTGKRSCFLNEFYTSAVVSRMALKHRQPEEEERYDIPFDMDDED